MTCTVSSSMCCSQVDGREVRESRLLKVRLDKHLRVERTLEVQSECSNDAKGITGLCISASFDS